MQFLRFRQNLYYAAVVVLLVGAVSNSRAPQAVAFRDYVKFALSTDFDIDVIAKKAKVLGSYSQKVRWDEFLNTLLPQRTRADHIPAAGR